MKKIGLVFSLVIFFSGSFQVSAQWEFQNPYPTSNALYDVKFLNDSIVFCVGDGGFIMKSTDAGITWKSVNSSTTYYLNRICFLDEQNCIAVGYHNTIVKSTDCGETWFQIQNGVTWNWIDPNIVFFLDQEIGWMGAQSLLLKTTDSGNSWDVIYNSFESFRFHDIYFSNDNYGFAVGPGLYTTTDGGVNWQYVNSGFTGLTRVHFYNQSDGIAIGDLGLIIKTSDGGISWEQKISYTNESLRAVDFKDSLNGIVVGVNGTILITTDGGESWENISNQFSEFENLYSTACNSKGVIISAGIKGELIRSTDNGLTWNRIREGHLNNFRSIYMLNRKKGWVVGDGGIILNTSNGGELWTTINIGTSVNLKDVSFVSESIGWIVGDTGIVLNTSDGGNSWNIINQFGNANLNSIYFTDKDFGWIVGTNGSIFATTDAGVNWINHSIPENQNLNSIYFHSRNLGWCTSFSGRVLKTTNGGNLWEQNLQSWIDIYSIQFIDTLNGWFVGSTSSDVEHIGWISRTTDGGINWDSFSYLWEYYFFDLYFYDVSRGWIFGKILGTGGNHREGVIGYTLDGGENISFQRTSTANGLYSASVVEDSIIWVVGNNGTILRNSNAQIPTVVEGEINSYTPSNFLLQQNYPNPFNPSTKISWQSPVGSWQTLKVYDILGNEVATLVNEYKNAGSYEIDFQSTVGSHQLANGVYFYQLRVGDPSSSSGQSFVETKKMILLK